MSGLSSASLGLAIGAGLLAALNPCGFALLPAYLSAFVIGDAAPDRRTALFRALKATTALTLGFGLIFTAAGYTITSFAAQLQSYLPYFTAALGLLLAAAGIWVAAGRKLPVIRLRRGRTAQEARPLVGSWPAMLGFGASYGLASLSCTLAPFLAVVTAGLRSPNPATGAFLFLAYSLGMGLTVGVAAVAIAIAHKGLITSLRRSGGLVPRLGGAVLAIAGLYVAWYGVWELRVLHGDTSPDPVVARAIRAQIWLASHAQQLGPLGIAVMLLSLTVFALTSPRMKGTRMFFKRRNNHGGAMKMQAIYNGTVIAESDDTVVVEGNHYFPIESLRREFVTSSATHTTCAWKGTASYYSVKVDGATERDAAWFYPNPTQMAAQVKDRVAFWRGVKVKPAPKQTDAVAPPSFDAPEGATC